MPDAAMATLWLTIGAAIASLWSAVVATKRQRVTPRDRQQVLDCLRWDEYASKERETK